MSMEVLKDLSEAEYQLWKRHPVSQILFQFLKDQHDDWLQTAIDRWQGGHLSLAEDHEIRHRIQLAEELIELKVDGIKQFYKNAGKLE